jgi:hypothetical protein
MKDRFILFWAGFCGAVPTVLCLLTLYGSFAWDGNGNAWGLVIGVFFWPTILGSLALFFAGLGVKSLFFREGK